MNRCDDRAGPLFATDFLTRAIHGPWAKARPCGRPNRLSCRFVEEVRSHCLRTTEKRFVANKGTSEGAAVFMNKPG
jgi:hypothetical protein